MTLQTLLATVTQPDLCTTFALRDRRATMQTMLAIVTLLDLRVAPVLRDIRAIATKKKVLGDSAYRN